ncbi:Solute carrier 38 member [Perkinsus olseni]|uniref:Solute carrier 38 member n=1 Tax=Perkinsus olseni TaxID=32597 RepID=A0A7J6KRW4_PEROL|nr:Solute carrier 38 member [Perkinsus olseni]KAF4649857.1 Solute carrier 38 member [Perkinsus olseni]
MASNATTVMATNDVQMPVEVVSVISTEGSVRDELAAVSHGVAPLNDGLKPQMSGASETSIPMEEMKPKKETTWASRTFAPGSSFTATIAVIKATLGGAILSNTYEMAIGGYVSAITLLILMAVLNVLSLDMIVKTVEKTGKRSYATIIEYLYGRKILYVFQIAMVVFCLGSSASYLVTVVDSLAPLFNQLTINEPHAWYHIMLTSRYYLSLIMLGIVMYPICLVKSLGSLRYLTIVSILGIFWLAVVALYLLGSNGISENFDRGHAYAPVSWITCIEGVTTYIFGYCNQANMPEIYMEMNPRSPKKLRWVAIWSAIVSTAVYLVIAIPFLLVFGSDAKSSVLINMADWIPQGDVVVIIGFIWTGISFIGTYPFMVYPVRVALINTFEPKRADFWGVVVVTIAVIISYLIDIALPDVSILMGIVGAIAGSILCFIAPGYFCISTSKSKKFFARENWLYAAFVILGCITLVGGTAISVYQILEFFQ